MTREDDFWNWFASNKASLENFISSSDGDYDIYDALSEKLKQYNENLIPELTINEENEFVLIISCDGIKEGIPYAEGLTKNLQQFENWEILRFRQPGPMESIPINGKEYTRRSILLKWEKTPGQKYHLTFFVKGYSSQNPDYEISTLLHMDHTIGEYNAMTRIEGVEIKKLGLFQSKKELKTLDDLKLALDSKFP